MISKDQLRKRIVRRLRKMQAELKQTIIDKEWWNDHRLDASPFDIGWDVMMLKYVTESLDAWNRDDIAAATASMQKMNDLTKEETEVG